MSWHSAQRARSAVRHQSSQARRLAVPGVTARPIKSAKAMLAPASPDATTRYILRLLQEQQVGTLVPARDVGCGIVDDFFATPLASSRPGRTSEACQLTSRRQRLTDCRWRWHKWPSGGTTWCVEMASRRRLGTPHWHTPWRTLLCGVRTDSSLDNPLDSPPQEP